MTKGQVEVFKKELEAAYKEYVECGPGADDVSLDAGLILLEESKQKCIAYSATKDEMVLSESLFGLPISQFSELINMENSNELYSKIYDIYKQQKEKREEWAVITW